MKRKSVVWALAAIIPVVALAVQVYWSYSPSSAESGQGYYVESVSSSSGAYIEHYLYKNGAYIGANYGNDWTAVGSNQTDYGVQNVEYRAEAFDSWDTYDQIYHYVSITQTNQAPIGAFDYADSAVTLGQNLSANGWAADNEMGAPVSRVDIKIDGTDVGDASLGDNRPDVSSAYGRGDFQYSGWHISYGTGGLGQGSHVIEMVAWDNNGSSTSLGSRNFTVTNAAPTNQLTSPAAQQIYLNTALQITAHATDPDGNITTHNLDIQRPDGSWNWQGGFAYGEPYMGGPVGSGADSTRSVSFAFNQTGFWHVRSWVSDANGNNIHTATVEINVIDPNHPPAITGWPALPPAYPNSGTNFTAQATGYDQDGNLSAVAVDMSVNGGAWTPFAYNGGGNGSTNTSDGNLVTTGAEGTTYQFRALASDTAGLNSGFAYTATYSVNRTPSVSMQILDAGLNPFPLGGNGRAQVPINTNYYVRVSGSDPDGRLAILYERHIPVGGTEVDNQVSVSGATAANNFGPFNAGPTAGMIDTWGHARDADAGGYVTSGQGWIYVGGPDIDVNKLTPSRVTITSGSTANYGTVYTATASGGNGGGALDWSLGAGSTAAGAAIDASTGAVTANSTGTVVIKARRLGDASYIDSAWTDDYPVTVGARPITVTISGSKVYDGTTASTGASASITGGSLAPGDSIGFTYAATSSPVAGSYTGLVTPAVSNGTTPTTRTSCYSITYTGSYAITPRAITVTLAGSKVYDGTTASAGASASITAGSLAPGDGIAYTFGALSSPVAGSYSGLTTATVSSASAPTARSTSYTITYAGIFTVTPRPITVSLAGSKVYDGTTASTGASASITAGSLASGDSIAYAFAALSSPLAGSYSDLTTATVSNASAPTARSSSYTITYTGSFTVTRRPITVTLAGTKVYDSTTTSTGASASITSGSLAAGDGVDYTFGAISSPVAGSYSGLTAATISSASAPTARSSSYAITYAGSYVVTPRPITVALSGSKTYDGTAASTGATAAITVGTLAGTDVIGFAFAACPGVVAGSYAELTTATIANPVAPTARTASYAITYAGNYTISPRPITVTLIGSKAYDGNTLASGASASITTGTLAAADTIGYAFAATSSANVGNYTALTTATVTNPAAPTARTASYSITHAGAFAITPGTQQPLTLNVVTSQDFGSSQTLTTTGGSGSGAVSFAIVGQSAVGVATLTGDSLTANTGTGWVDLQATKAAELNYQAITSSMVRVNFARINQAELTVTATPAAIFYGETSALVSSGGSGTGAVSYSSATGGSISGSTFTATAGTGTALVTATKAADADYNAASGTTNITLAKRSITVTLAGSKTADGNTTPTGAAASITSGSLAAGDTITYAYAATSSATAGFYAGLTTGMVKNFSDVDVSADYDITYAGTYTIWPAPAVASGLRAWYRPDFGITKDGTGSVSQWMDASGHGFHLTQTDPLKQPFWAGNALNGQPLIDFAGGERLKSAAIDLLDATAAGQDLTVLILFQPAAAQLAGAAVLDHEAQAQQGFAFQQDGTATNKYMLRWRNEAQTSWQGEGSPSTYATGQPHLITFIKSGTTQTAYVNGEAAGSATVEQNMHKAVAAFAVGGSAANAADYFGGRIAEVMIFNRALSPAERSSVESEFGTRYGLANIGAEPDGLPDAWELQYFGHLGYGPDDDPDGDGLTNMQEYLLGRHPLKGQVPDTTGAVNLRVYSPNR